MKQISLILLIALISFTGCSQTSSEKNKVTPHVGGHCEGCEAIHESPVSFEKLSHLIMLPDFNEEGPKLFISGTVYKNDGKTPAKDVVIYVYHTDQTGHYSTKGNDPDSHREGWGKRHGYIRGWMKTNEKGEYQFYTLKPLAYPGAKIPAHIHVTIKEPGLNEYYIDEFLFDDDSFLTREERNKQENRGGNGIGNGIVTLKKDHTILMGKRNIILGKNIPDYPAK